MGEFSRNLRSVTLPRATDFVVVPERTAVVSIDDLSDLGVLAVSNVPFFFDVTTVKTVSPFYLGWKGNEVIFFRNLEILRHDPAV